MKLIYVGPHASVVSTDFVGVAERDGEPIDVPKDIALGLIDRGDFIEYAPEPRRQPVERNARAT